MLLAGLQKIRLWRWRRRYRRGEVLTRFIACDIRRDVEVVDTSRIEAGVISARTRTWNVLYAVKNIAPEPAFGAVREIAIKDLWNWPGEPWGGPVPASTDRAAG
jgi:hypothetical protein